MPASCRGGPWSADERAAILEYCESDVLALERLLPAMLPRIDLPRALLRGRFMKAAAAIEWNGTPIDTATLDLLRHHWTGIQDDLIADIDRDYGVFDGRSFRVERWQRWLARYVIPWPMLDTGRLDLSDDTFRQMARAILRCRRCASCAARCPTCGSPILRSAVTDATAPPIGVPLADRRCQPSNTKYIFGPVSGCDLIQPPAGCGVAYIDWCQQEHGIAAVLSGDRAMQAAYFRGIPTLSSPSRRAPFLPTLPRVPRAQARIVQAVRSRRRLRHGGRRLGAADWQVADRRPRPAAGPLRNLSPLLGLVRRGGRHARCCPAHSRRCSAGRSTSAMTQIPGHCAIFPARLMAPKCCGWPPALPPSRALRSAR